MLGNGWLADATESHIKNGVADGFWRYRKEPPVFIVSEWAEFELKSYRIKRNDSNISHGSLIAHVHNLSALPLATQVVP